MKMNRYARGMAVAGACVLPVVGLAAPAQAADVTIRGTSETGPQEAGTTPDGDVVENRNLGAGAWEFLRDGLAMTAPAGDRSGVYWASASQEFPDSVSQDWRGTRAADGVSPQVSTVIYIDVDGDGPIPRDALLHEDIYGEGDLWLPESGSAEAKAASPGESSGSSFAGPIEEWKANLEQLYGEELTIVQVGVNLSDAPNGGRSDGVLRSVMLGDDTYTFTSDEEVVEPVEQDVNGSVRASNRTNTSIRLDFTSQQQPEGVTEGAPLRWRVAVDNRTAASFVQGFGERDTFRRVFQRRTGAHTVKVFKNGEQVRQYVIRTNR